MSQAHQLHLVEHEVAMAKSAITVDTMMVQYGLKDTRDAQKYVGAN